MNRYKLIGAHHHHQVHERERSRAVRWIALVVVISYAYVWACGRDWRALLTNRPKESDIIHVK